MRAIFLLLGTITFSWAHFLDFPVQPSKMGNKKRQAVPKFYAIDDHGACDNYIESWRDWGNGFEAAIKACDSPESFKVSLTLTKPVTSLTSYDGTVEEENRDKTKFTIVTKDYNKAGSIHIQGQYDKNSSPPKPRALSFDSGTRVVCHEEHEEEQNESFKEDSDEEEQDSETQNKPAIEDEVLQDRGVHVKMPKKVMGLYVLLADDLEKGYEGQNDSWVPRLYHWQQKAANVLFFTFIHPDDMEIPLAFKKLAATRGTREAGAVPADTVIIFAIGGYAYSLKPNPWHWLESKEAAEKMAVKVAKWPQLYNCDGIDLDLEEGAGAHIKAGTNMVHFIKKLRELKPDMIISQPAYGYPQVHAESHVINESWDDKGNYKNVADTVGLMVYEGTQALNYVKNYAKGSEQWEGFPIKVNVPTNRILLGSKGISTSQVIKKLSKAAVDQDLLGVMVWYASVKNKLTDEHGLQYHKSWDASMDEDSIQGYIDGREILDKAY